MIPFEPTDGVVLCEAPEDLKTEGGIVVPHSDEDGICKMKVVKVGPGEVTETGYRRELDIEPGRYYYFAFPQYAIRNRLTLKGQKYVVAQAKFICGREVY